MIVNGEGRVPKIGGAAAAFAVAMVNSPVREGSRRHGPGSWRVREWQEVRP